MNKTVLILAGGLATRLKPLSDKLPKSLIPILGKPFIDLQLANVKNYGANEVLLALAHDAELIIEHLKTNKVEGVSLKFSVEEKPKGTASAILKALPQLSDVFFVLYGDSYLFCDFNKMYDAFIKQEKPAMMSVFKNNNRRDKSNVLYENGEILLYEKGSPKKEIQHIDYGLSVFRKDIFKHCTHEDLSDFFKELVDKRLMAAFEVEQPFFEVGSFAGIKALEEYFS